MAKVMDVGKDYSPLELLKMAIMGTGKKMLSPPEIKAKDEWSIASPEVRQSAIDALLWESLAGIGGAVKMSGGAAKAAGVVKHTILPETLEKIAKERGVPFGNVTDVSRKLIEKMEPGMGSEKGFLNRLRRVFTGNALLSPETIYNLEKTGIGRQIYRTIDLADQSMNKFQVQEFNKFHTARGVIDKGSKESVRVGRALDGKMPISGKKPAAGESVVQELSKKEVELYEFLKKKFDFLINRYARNTLNDEAAYKKIAHAASVDASRKPMVAVKDLSKKLKNEYDRVASSMIKKVGVSSFKHMTGKEKKIVEKYQERFREIKHRGWVEQLSKTERSVYDLMSRKISNYLPHIFDRDELIKGFGLEKDLLERSLKLATDPKELTKIKKRLVSLDKSISDFRGGKLVMYQQLPQNLRFKFFDTRKGAQGYSFDAVKAYEAYLNGMTKKLFQEPALKKVGILYEQLDPVMREYTKQHVTDWVGMGRKRSMELADAITTYQWMAKLGMNPRSAITNAAQKINTIAEVGEGNALRGYFKGWTKEGTELFEKTGLGQEVPTVLLEGQVPKKLQKAKEIMGYLFTKVEMGNRKHAFLAGVEQGKELGLKGQELIQHGIDVVHKTQFRYGSVGMPAPLRTATGKIMFQFMSYTIKQIEFLAKLLKNNPKGLAKWVLYAEGGRKALREYAGVDLGNAMGLGLDYEEVGKSLKQLSDGEIESAFRHAKLSVQGGGIFPSIGPTPSSLLKIGEGFDKGLMEGVKTIGKEMAPIQGVKMWKGMKALRGGKEFKGGENRYPWEDSNGALDVYLSAPELASEVFGPKTVATKEVSEQKAEDYSYKGLETGIEQQARDLLTSGSAEDIIKAIKLKEGIGREVSDEQLEEGVLRKSVPYKSRKLLDRTEQDEALRILNP